MYERTLKSSVKCMSGIRIKRFPDSILVNNLDIYEESTIQNTVIYKPR